MISSHNYHSVMDISLSHNPFSPTFNPQKILYFNTYFGNRLDDPSSNVYCEQQLSNFFNYDIVLIPFFNYEDEDNEETRALLVIVNPHRMQVDLFDRDNR